MTPLSLIRYIEENFSIEETILEVNDLIETLEHNPKFKEELKESLIEYSKSFNRCPECGQNLEVIDSYTEYYEFWGSQVSKEFKTYGCICGYTEEDD